MKLIHNIEEFKQKYNGDFIKHNKLSAEVLEYYINNCKVEWNSISMYQTLSESFIEQYSDRVWWFYISMNQTLSEQFIDKYSDRVYWTYISRYQTLSEQFIEQYIDKLDWTNISMYQNISEDFIGKYNDRLNWYSLFRNKKITLRYGFLVEHIYEFNLYDVSIYIKNIDTYIKNIELIKRVIKEFPDKYEIDKLTYEFNSNN